jgi:hypothetical protein
MMAGSALPSTVAMNWKPSIACDFVSIERSISDCNPGESAVDGVMELRAGWFSGATTEVLGDGLVSGTDTDGVLCLEMKKYAAPTPATSAISSIRTRMTLLFIEKYHYTGILVHTSKFVSSDARGTLFFLDKELQLYAYTESL